MNLDEWLAELRRSKNFYAHVFLRHTHRPWRDVAGLYALVGETPPEDWDWPNDASCARRAALQQPDAFAALRRRALAEADRTLEKIFDATRDLPDVTYLVYSNHGEVFDHFRYQLPHPDPGDGMIRGTSQARSRTRCSTRTCRCGCPRASATGHARDRALDRHRSDDP